MKKYQVVYGLKLLKQFLTRPEIGIIGGYHGGNVGDLALGQAVKDFLSSKGIVRSDLQTIHNFQIYPKAKKYIIGGGALLDNEKLDNIRNRVRPMDLTVIGCEFSNAHTVTNELSKTNLKFLQSISYFSLRNSSQYNQYEHLLSNLASHPDIVFGWQFLERLRLERSQTTSGKVGISVILGCGKDYDGALKQNERSSEDEVKINSFTRTFFRQKVQKALQEGKEVHHYPFAHKDMDSVRDILEGLPVIHHKYEQNPRILAKEVSTCDYYISSRLHSLIFCLTLGVPTSTFLYARKNYWLRDDYFPKMNAVGYREVLSNEQDVFGKIDFEPYLAEESVLLDMSMKG